VDAENPNITSDDPLADKVQVNLHVLRALMLHGIGGEVHHADVVAVDEASALEGVVELVEKLA
jgi:nucleoside-triphosphatase THEP1